MARKSILFIWEQMHVLNKGPKDESAMLLVGLEL